MRHLRTLVAVVVCYLMSASPAAAVPVPVPDFSFNNPNLNGNDASEQFSVANIGPNWTVTTESGTVNNFGVQDPPTQFYGAQGPLPAPFDGRQFGFVNLDGGGGGSSARVDSVLLGVLGINEIYTLNVAVGARNNTATGNVNYFIGLVADTGGAGTELGTFSTITLDPGSAPTVISDLLYSLNVSAQAGAFVGQNFFVRIRSTNTSNAFTQGNFDNVRLNLVAVIPEPATATLGVLALAGLMLRRRRAA